MYIVILTSWLHECACVYVCTTKCVLWHHQYRQSVYVYGVKWYTHMSVCRQVNLRMYVMCMRVCKWMPILWLTVWWMTHAYKSDFLNLHMYDMCMRVCRWMPFLWLTVWLMKHAYKSVFRVFTHLPFDFLFAFRYFCTLPKLMTRECSYTHGVVWSLNIGSWVFQSIPWRPEQFSSFIQ